MSNNSSEKNLLNPLHVPTRRENSNSTTSIQIGSRIPSQLNVSPKVDHRYSSASRYEMKKPIDTLNVYSVGKAVAYLDPEPESVQK